MIYDLSRPGTGQKALHDTVATQKKKISWAHTAFAINKTGYIVYLKREKEASQTMGGRKAAGQKNMTRYSQIRFKGTGNANQLERCKSLDAI